MGPQSFSTSRVAFRKAVLRLLLLLLSNALVIVPKLSKLFREYGLVEGQKNPQDPRMILSWVRLTDGAFFQQWKKPLTISEHGASHFITSPRTSTADAVCKVKDTGRFITSDSKWKDHCATATWKVECELCRMKPTFSCLTKNFHSCAQDHSIKSLGIHSADVASSLKKDGGCLEQTQGVATKITECRIEKSHNQQFRNLNLSSLD